MRNEETNVKLTTGKKVTNLQSNFKEKLMLFVVIRCQLGIYDCKNRLNSFFLLDDHSKVMTENRQVVENYFTLHATYS